MLTTKRKPATVGEILTEEFMQPMGLTQGALAEAMGVQRKHVNELCGNRRNVTAATALILARVFGNELRQRTKPSRPRHRHYSAFGQIRPLRPFSRDGTQSANAQIMLQAADLNRP